MSEASSSDMADREIRATRLFNTPRDLVFQMWTDREHVAKEFGAVQGLHQTLGRLEQELAKR
jgi:uncharacterized protein YndB with AHSA1/START domain